MRLEVFAVIMLAALLLAAANLLLRGGLLAGGGLSFDGAFMLQMGRLFTQPLFLIGVFFYAAATIVWFFALSMENLSSSYPILVGATFICVTLGAVLFFQEAVSLPKGLGMLLIVFGIAAVALAP